MMSVVRVLGPTAAAVVCALAAVDVRAQEPLPTAEKIVARYHEAVGAEAFAAIRSLHSVGLIAIPAAGLTGTLQLWQARPNRTLIRATLPGFGDVQTGYTGTSGWSVDPADGPRVLAGAEGTQAQDDAEFDSHLRTASLVQSMSAVERTTLSGHACYKIHTVWKSGRETADCYSVDNGLLIGSTRRHYSTAGATEAVVIYEDYRVFAGARLPTRITTRIEGVEQVITLQNITLNSVPDSVFTPPVGIRRLIGG